jgi:uncharacterized membrane protein YecN with MAPEG domain
VKVRWQTHIGLGSEDNEILTRQMRVQANLLENLLPFSILFILAEINDTSVIFLKIVGIVFLVARLIHAHGFSHKSGRSFGRYYGTVASWLSLAALILVNLYHVIMQLF